MRSTYLLALLVVIPLVGAGASAQQTGDPGTPPILIESMAGADSFERYCAPCHGSDGRGDGPVAPALRAMPPDLTRLTQRNGGAFPAELVRGFVTGTGRALAAHGTTEMPVWGPMFRAFESDARTRQRIDNLVSHVAAMQAASTGPNDPGRQLFMTYCASCHGRDAHGDGPVAGALRRMPPDLTQFAARNGGVFPSEQVARIIDGREVAAHGDRDMPIWGDVFRVSGGNRAEVEARIEAITRYLQAIQERIAWRSDDEPARLARY